MAQVLLLVSNNVKAKDSLSSPFFHKDRQFICMREFELAISIFLGDSET